MPDKNNSSTSRFTTIPNKTSYKSSTDSKRDICIGSKVHDNESFLRCLHTSRRSIQKRKRIIQEASTEQLLTLVEIALNILYSRVPFRVGQRTRLIAQAENIRELSRVRSPNSARRVLLNSERFAQLQKGKGLPLAIPLASLFASIILPFITEQIGNQKQL
jgi:hypothetical protein